MDGSARDRNEPDEDGGRWKRGLLGVVFGAFAVGTCLHIAAAVAAVVLGLSMITIALAGDAAIWLGLGIVAVLVVVAAVEFRAVRHGH